MSILNGVLMGVACAAFVAAIAPREASDLRRNAATLFLLALVLMVRWLPR